MKNKKALLLVAILWLAIIAGIILVKEYTLKTGNMVLLKIVPVDPLDLFRGEYVNLRYDISNLDLNQLKSDKAEYKSGERLYVSLIKDGIAVKAVSISSARPQGALFIRGNVANIRGKRLRVVYGIESYFVEEGKGKEIERKMRQGLYAKVAIDKSGKAVIKSLKHKPSADR